MKQLNLENLSIIKNCKIIKSSPNMARIAHFGVGNFHRSHQCQYNDETMEITKDQTWGILGVGIKPFDVKMNNILSKQNFLYSLMIKSKDKKDEIKIIKSIIEHIDGYNNPLLAIKKVGNIQIQIISLTITEGGYYINKNTGTFDQKNQEIKKDYQSCFIIYQLLLENEKIVYEKINNISSEKFKFLTVFPYLLFSLLIQKNINHPITILSCDNIQNNGKVIKNSLVSFIKLIDIQLALWVQQNCKFPSCMVDRITPQTSESDKANIQQIINVRDDWPVCCQPFKQWIIQDQFVSNIRPKWQLAGACFVDNVLPYQKIKLRLLNGAHQAISYLGYLKNYEYVHQAAQDELIVKMALKYMKEEVEETLSQVSDINIDQYQKTIMKRFGNQKILDTLSRICEYSTDRIPIFNLSSSIQIISKNQNRRLPLTGLILASWIIFLQTKLIKDQQQMIIDNRKQKLLQIIKKSQQQKICKKILLQFQELFGILSQNQLFLTSFQQGIYRLKKYGVDKAIQSYLQM